jgi:hypothetical protein
MWLGKKSRIRLLVRMHVIGEHNDEPLQYISYILVPDQQLLGSHDMLFNSVHALHVSYTRQPHKHWGITCLRWPQLARPQPHSSATLQYNPASIPDC